MTALVIYSEDGAEASSTTPTVDALPSPVAGDVVVIAIESGALTAAPAGFTLRLSFDRDGTPDTGVGNGGPIDVYTKIVEESEPAFTFTYSAARAPQWRVWQLRGVPEVPDDVASLNAGVCRIGTSFYTLPQFDASGAGVAIGWLFTGSDGDTTTAEGWAYHNDGTTSFYGFSRAISAAGSYAGNYVNSAAGTSLQGYESSFSMMFVANEAPTVAASEPADAAVLDDTTPDLTVLVSENDSGQTLTTEFQVSTSSTFSSIFADGTAPTSVSPAAGEEHTWTVDSAVTKGTTYYWRARTSDGIATSDWTTTRSFIIYDNPTVTVTAPAEAAAVSTGGPELEVAWTYSHPNALPQLRYRVRFHNDADTETYFDSGWLSGAATSLDVDLQANGVPTDSTDVSVTVQVDASSDGGLVGSDTNAFSMEWGVVTVEITAPVDGAVVTGTSLDPVTWTYDDSRATAQAGYRVRLLSSGVVLHDSGWVTSTATTYEIPTGLVDGTAYSVGVNAKNARGVENSA